MYQTLLLYQRLPFILGTARKTPTPGNTESTTTRLSSTRLAALGVVPQRTQLSPLVPGTLHSSLPPHPPTPARHGGEKGLLLLLSGPRVKGQEGDWALLLPRVGPTDSLKHPQDFLGLFSQVIST